MSWYKLALFFWLGAVVPTLSLAQARQAVDAAPKSKPALESDVASVASASTRLVVFTYDGNLTYKILAKDQLFTHLELRPGEKVQGFYLSDTNRWKHHVSGDRERLFVKPTLPGLFTSGTLVTNRRAYELVFSSGPATGDAPWYQRVRWSIADEGRVPYEEATGVYEGGLLADSSAKHVGKDMGVERRLGSLLSTFGGADSVSSGAPLVQPDKLNFGYAIEGDAEFRPKAVFDDGKFTWVQITGSQSLPALFELHENGSAEVVNYVVHGDYILVSRLMNGILLKLGAKEVRVVRKPSCHGFWCS